MRDQVLVEHFLVADFRIDLVVQLEVYPIEADHLLAVVPVIVEAIDLLINHLHDLVFVEAV